MAFNIKIRNTNEAVNQTVAKDSPIPAKYIKAIIYGQPGSGKTYFLGSANNHPMTANIIVADVDEGTLTLEGMNIDYIPIQKWKDIQEAYELLVKYTHWRDMYLLAESAEVKNKAVGQMAVLLGATTQEEFEAFKANVPIFFTVAIDTTTELQKKNMTSVMASMLNVHPDRDPDVPSVREWGISGNQMRDIIKKFKSLDMHVFFTFHTVYNKDEVLGTIEQLPSLPGKLAPEVPGYVDIVGHMSAWVDKDTGEFKNALYVQNYGQHTALKDRTHALGAGMEMPTIPKIFEAIEKRRLALAANMDKPRQTQVIKEEPEPEAAAPTEEPSADGELPDFE